VQHFVRSALFTLMSR